ncbi:Uncharacterized conserved protein [Pseudomonas syringae pv. actinidiae]|uniref:Uncharacterized conserved protein n=1 Tax=Pseudomonas syringae pv. actinidiae TaxID=103796 RepID=A0A2V0QBA1_PSESF|nr:Uncharacterized conserved protein [Pseudomonas syringae pv. actinidiae]
MQADARQQQQQYTPDKASTKRWQRRFQCGSDCSTEGDTHDNRNDCQNTQQFTNRIGFENVIEYLIGIDQVVHCNKVEPHTEFVPEQPFGDRHKQHDENAQRHEPLKKPAVPAGTPQNRRAEKCVNTQWYGGVSQEGDVIE